MRDEKINILFLEDRQDDVDLCLFELKKLKSSVSFKVVDQKHSFYEEINNHAYDIVLADYQLPTWNGINALKWLRQRGNLTPFILVTGAIGEETAAECIRQGADNYILKDNLARLVPAIEQALYAYKIKLERKQALEHLKESEGRLRAIFNSAIDAIYTKNLAGQFTRVNDAFKKLVGRQESEIIGKTIFDLLPPVLARQYHQLDQRVFQGESVSEEIVHEENNRKYILQLNQVPLWGSNRQVIGLSGFVRDISAQKNTEHRIRLTLESAIHAIIAIVEQRDPYTIGHQQRVSKLAVAIAGKMNFSPDRIEGLRIAALVHDIGKASLPAEILSKPLELSEAEKEILRTHAELGANILRQIPFPWDIARFVEEHHERLDGSGYPKGLHGEQISLEARIIGIADVVVSISTNRPYRPAKNLEDALEDVKCQSGVKYDPQVIEAILKLVTEDYFSTENSP